MMDIARKRFFRHRQNAASSAMLPPDCENTARNQRGGPHLSAWGLRPAMGRRLKLGGRRSRCFPHRIKIKLPCRKFALVGIGNMHQ